MTDTSSTRWIVAAAAGYIAYRTYQHLKQTPSTAAAAATAAPPYPRQTTPVQPPPPLPQKRSIGGSGGAAAAATTATSNRPSPTITRLQSPPLLAETVTAATAEAKLLPPPVAVRSFLVQTNNNDEGGATGPDGELRHADAAAAAEWLAETAAAAHSSPKLKAAGRALLGIETFAANLNIFRERDKLPPSTSFLVNSRTLMGCTPSVSSRVGSKLPLPLYADMRLHIPMTHRNDAGTGQNVR